MSYCFSSSENYIKWTYTSLIISSYLSIFIVKPYAEHYFIKLLLLFFFLNAFLFFRSSVHKISNLQEALEDRKGAFNSLAAK